MGLENNGSMCPDKENSGIAPEWEKVLNSKITIGLPLMVLDFVYKFQMMS